MRKAIDSQRAAVVRQTGTSPDGDFFTLPRPAPMSPATEYDNLEHDNLEENGSEDDRHDDDIESPPNGSLDRTPEQTVSEVKPPAPVEAVNRPARIELVMPLPIGSVDPLYGPEDHNLEGILLRQLTTRNPSDKQNAPGGGAMDYIRQVLGFGADATGLLRMLPGLP